MSEELNSAARDWPEDYASGENQYDCACSICGNRFFGHKRRLTCKACGALVTPLTPSPEQEPKVPITGDEMAALRRFHECACDGEGYDVPDAMMRRLSEIGLVRRPKASMSFYEHTEFGLFVLGEWVSTPPAVTAKPDLAAPVEQASRSIAPKSASGRLLPGADKFVDLMRAWRFANVGGESERTFSAVVAHVDQWAASIPPLQAPEAPESVRDAAAQRLLRAAKVYTFNYLQDEHEEPELCTCGPKQHAELAELFSAISAMEGKAQ